MRSPLPSPAPRGRCFSQNTPDLVVSALLLAASALAALGCSGGKSGGTGCVKDTDCKGDRVCQAGSCVDTPAAGNRGNPAQPPPGPRAPGQGPSPAAPPPVSGNPFRAVPEAEWVPVIGPRMRIGAVVAHQVFEGPIGPSPKSLFVVTREGTDFFATVWADGHGHRTETQFARNGSVASKIPAVAFFDADGDGSMDALVMAMYTPPDGGSDFYDNVLLRWDGKNLTRIFALEPAIQTLESVAAIRAKLRR